MSVILEFPDRCSNSPGKKNNKGINKGINTDTCYQAIRNLYSKIKHRVPLGHTFSNDSGCSSPEAPSAPQCGGGNVTLGWRGRAQIGLYFKT